MRRLCRLDRRSRAAGASRRRFRRARRLALARPADNRGDCIPSRRTLAPAGERGMTNARLSTILALTALAAIAAPALAQPATWPPIQPGPPNSSANASTGNLDIAYGAFQRGFYLTALA